jgi:hypothetical protein
MQTFADLNDRDELKRHCLDALYRIYYSAAASSPQQLSDFETTIRTELLAAGVQSEDADSLASILSVETRESHSSDPRAFAAAYLERNGRLQAEDIFSDATDLFTEQYWDEASGRYYDAAGNWYDADHRPIEELHPEHYKDEASGLHYDAAGNWYDADHQPLVREPAPSAQQPAGEQLEGLTEELTAILARALADQPALAAASETEVQQTIERDLLALFERSHSAAPTE